MSHPQDAEGRRMEAEAFTKIFGNAEPARLDFRKPPPGYRVFRPRIAVVWRWFTTTEQAGEFVGPSEALAAAWAHYKERHDPPGMWTADHGFGVPSVDGLGCRLATATQGEARAAAWHWYEARLATSNILRQRDYEAWPRCLTWSDKDHDEVKAWIVQATAFMMLERPDLPQMPAVLRG